ncbi:MAG: CPBP family intramembrane glutamic endopeptidase [Bacteroidota bacterium]
MKKVSPFIIGIIVICTIGTIMQIPFDKIPITGHFTPFQTEYLALTLKMGLIFCVGMIGIKKFRLKHLSGLSPNYKWTSKLLNLIPIYLFFIGVSAFMGKDITTVSIANVLLLLFACLAVGFAEEFIFRGFLQPIFIRKFISKKNGVFLGIFFPAIFFGASHLLNLTVNDNVLQVIVQSIYALLIGFFFGVLILKTNRLLPVAITHGLINFFFLFNSLPNLNGQADVISEPQTPMTVTMQILTSFAPLILFLPLFIVGILILRKVEKEQIQKKLDNQLQLYSSAR